MTAPLAAVLDPFTPFAVPFLLRPLLLLVSLAVAAGTVGMLVHLRRLEFSADGLTHAVFPGLAIGAALGGAAGLLPGALGAALVAAVVLALLSRRGQPRDTAVAIVLTTFFSVGIVLVSRSQGTGSVSDFFFGRLLTITWADLWIAVALVAAGVVAVVATARPQLFAAFDAAGARRAGLPVLALEVLGTVAVALVVVAASSSVGTLLALAVVIVPAAAARALTRSLRAAAVVATAFGALTGWLGLWLVVLLAESGVDAAPGATVALTMIAGYLVALAVSALRPRSRRRTAAPA